MNEPDILNALKELGKSNEPYENLRLSLLRMRYNYRKQYRRIMDRLIKLNFKDANELQKYLKPDSEEVK